LENLNEGGYEIILETIRITILLEMDLIILEMVLMEEVLGKELERIGKKKKMIKLKRFGKNSKI